MTHDIEDLLYPIVEDLLEMIHALELRIINLEKEISNKVMPIVPTDSYYWEHG